MTGYIFYDTETTGANPRYDQVLQFAAIRTDENFTELDEIDVRSRLAPHIVPSAGALKVTGVDPYSIARAPNGPHEFASMLHRLLLNWAGSDGAAFLGYNSLRFDEEIMRQMFWENLLDPYISSRKGSTRNDILIFLRAIHARNPELITIPVGENGKKSFKLENIAPLNGFNDHDAHDALGDVRATIHLANLIRRTDPNLFAQMIKMGDSRAAEAFAEENIVFRMLGGPMVNPGILDVCLIASEAQNTKNKVAWNLAIDPTPYLDLSAQEILAAMRKTGTPFRNLKCSRNPAIFPIGWEFLNRVQNDDFEPADPATIDMRAEIIRSHQPFQMNVVEALRLRSASYAPNETLESKIYEGFPSWTDKRKMEEFQNQPDWQERLKILRTIEKPEVRQLGVRLIYVNAPEEMSPAMRETCEKAIADTRHCLDLEKPWTTVGTLMAEVDDLLEANPEDEEALNIRKWALETYPQAAEWKGREAAKAEMAARKAAEDAAANLVEDNSDQDAVPAEAPAMVTAADHTPAKPEAETPAAEPELPSASDIVSERQKVAGAHFLDGLV